MKKQEIILDVNYNRLPKRLRGKAKAGCHRVHRPKQALCCSEVEGAHGACRYKGL